MAIATDSYSAEDAVKVLLELGGGKLIRGKTASQGSRDFDHANAIGQVFDRCDCGRQKKGWVYPEFVVREGPRKVLSIGGDAKTGKVSCGYKGIHSKEYGGDFDCPTFE
jgi:hypothetical protein